MSEETLYNQSHQSHQSVIFVDTLSALQQAISGPSKRIIIRKSLSGVPNLKLQRGTTISGVEPNISLSFLPGVDGLEVSEDNTIASIKLVVQPNRKAIYNSYNSRSLGKCRLNNVEAIGQVQILAKGKLSSGRLYIDNLNIIFADTIAQPERPSTGTTPEATNIDVLQGALTILNLQNDSKSVIEIEARGINIGTNEQPVYGSGILISGADGNIYTNPGSTIGGRVEISVLETGNIYNDSRIALGTSSLISGSVFVAYADAKLIVNSGKTVSYGVNGLGLDNWGRVEQWICIAPVETYGVSGIGVVNYGYIKHLSVATIETFGSGARTYNVLSGSVENTYLGWVRTHADGATGILIRKPIGRLVVNGDIETFGSEAESLSSGHIYLQPSCGLRFEGGSAKEVLIGGNIITRGQSSPAVQLDNSKIKKLRIIGRVWTNGSKSIAFNITDSEIPLSDIEVSSSLAEAILLQNARLSEFVGTRAHGAVGDLVVQTNSRVVTTAGNVEQLSSQFGNSFAISGAGSLTLVALGLTEVESITTTESEDS